MTRPNLYPYTKNQWEKEITLVYFGVNTSLKLRAERNRITKETRHVILESTVKCITAVR